MVECGLGFFRNAELLESGPIMFLAGFAKTIAHNKILVFALTPERVPIIANE